MGLDSPLKWLLFFKPVGRWTIALAITAALSTSAIGIYQFYQEKNRAATPAPTTTITPVKPVVSALGRLEPKGEVTKLSAPSSQEGVRVAQLLVKQGDQVQLGQLVAVLDNRDKLQAALEEAKRHVQVAQANRAKVIAGAKQGEIEAQKAETGRLEAQLQGEIASQNATIARLQAQLNGEIKTQNATIARLQAQLNGEIRTQQAAIARWQAQRMGERNTQLATIARLKAELNNALSEFNRYQMLYQQGAVEASKFDSKRLVVDTAREQLNQAQAALRQSEDTLEQQINQAKASLWQSEATLSEQIIEAKASLRRSEETLEQQIKEAEATRNKTIDTLKQQINQSKATLNQIAEVRPTDVQAAQAEVERAIAALKKAQAELDLAYVRSPIDGQVLKIHTRAGERVSDDGVVELGQTDQMYVVAEVYETEINKVALGQPARIKSSAFSGDLKGTVDQLGMKIGKKDILNDDPASDKDARVVEVKIRLDPEDSKRVTRLTNLQVEVTIDVAKSPSTNPENSSQSDL